jgi:soluble lytic murein transglycosylase
LALVLPWLAPAVAVAQTDSSLSPSKTVAAPAARWHAAIAARSALKDSLPSAGDLLAAVDAELTLGRPDRARTLLQRYQGNDPQFAVRHLAADAASAYASGGFQRAGELYAEAASRSDGRSGAILLARAADAYGHAGNATAAAAAYQRAREGLREISGWLALREAQVTRDTAVAFKLLEQVPPAGRRLVPRVRGEFFALAGDTARAVVVMAGASFDGRAAGLALAAGDSANARQLTYRALRSGDTAISNAGVLLASGPVPPRTPEEFVLLARATRRQSAARAAGFVASAVTLGDSTPRTLLLWGDLLAEAGLHDRAYDVYRRVPKTAGPEAAQAEFSAARTLIRLGRPVGAFAALTAFVNDHPTHVSLPLASFLRADLSPEAGHRELADSLYRVVLARWPEHDYASQARVRLAGRAIIRGDTARALELYRGEVESRGVQQLVARYLLGELAWRKGDTAAAHASWTALARVDSLGYYGSLARGRLGLGLPKIDPPVASRPPAAALTRAMDELDALDEVGFASEAATLVTSLVVDAGEGEAALDLAEALAARGRTTQAIALGWRASRTRTLNDARVLRAIYPWPLRDVLTAEAAEFDLDPYLVAALVRQESSFDIGARSRAGARGLMQVMPGTARQAARRMGLEWSDHLLHVPDANMHVGAAHLSLLLRHYKGDLVLTLAAYNAGRTPVELWRRFPEARDPALFVERIPYAETRGYVRSVLRNLSMYRVLYPPTS